MNAVAVVPIYFWALPFLAALGFTILIERFCVRWQLFDHPGERKMQIVPVPRLGGMAFFLVSLIFCKLLSAVAPWELIAGSLIVYLGGMYDDLSSSNSVINKLAFQIPAALVFAIGTDLTYLNATVPQLLIARIAIFMLVFFLTNAANLMDNMNGLTAGLAMVILAGLSLTAATRDLSLTTLGILVAVSLAGFYVRNYPQGKIYMGDQGSQFLGFFISAYAILVIPHVLTGSFTGVFTKTLLAVFIIFGLFIFDVVTVVRIRLKEGRSPFQGDQCHISHRLVKRGLSPVKAVLVLSIAQMILTLTVLAVFGFGGLLTTF